MNMIAKKRAGTSLKSLPLDCLLDGGGDPSSLSRRELVEEGGYVFFLGRLLRHFGVTPRAAIHLGGNTGQESIPYMMMGFEKVLYVEAHPETCTKLRANLEQLNLMEREVASYLGTRPVTEFAAVEAAVSDKAGRGTLFLMGSSLFASTRRPVDFSEWVSWVLERSTPAEAAEFSRWAGDELKPTGQIEVRYQTLDAIMKQELPPGWKREDFNVLGMNIQGAELDALKGARETLRYVEFIQTELNYVEHYEGNPTADQLDTLLWDEGFKSVARVDAGPVGTGVYIRR